MKLVLAERQIDARNAGYRAGNGVHIITPNTIDRLRGVEWEHLVTIGNPQFTTEQLMQINARRRTK